MSQTIEFAHAEARLASGVIPYRVGGSGRPLLHLHSTGGIKVTQPLEALAAKHRVLMPVMPGFDDTPDHRGVGTMGDLTDLVAGFLDGVGIASCDVIGHSFGGYLALWLGLKHPKRVEQMVLEAPAGLRFGAVVAPPQAQGDARQERNRKSRDRYGTGKPVDEALAVRVGEIAARTLILFGTRDTAVPRETGVFLKAKLPASHLAYVYDAGHSIEVDQPARFLRIVDAYLERGEAYIVNWGKEAAGAA